MFLGTVTVHTEKLLISGMEEGEDEFSKKDHDPGRTWYSDLLEKV